ncbi:hypothetical protein HH1059_09690 [Halorhodospira halochloris]|uniref:MEMO1 family protein n=1 Tax=Halorhodospira halochloris TaxID=1052 RepID=A0A0X8XA21_HALHR|nr:AmmeMemoRadiSam system protein B [Halorhodospira halochloris]BAU57663.1 hypothetical protein HH1059_09690 [Halorhodospira halochloris]
MREMGQNRLPAVAGRFYPDNPTALASFVDDLLAKCDSTRGDSQHKPQAMILPHAGYPFSGAAAAQGYARVRPFREQIRHIVLLGPSHFVDFQGVAVPTVTSFTTPLGDVRINETLRTTAGNQPGVLYDDAPHSKEHSIEVHLPFLQRIFKEFDFLPLAVGRMKPEECGQLIDSLLSEETLIVVSSDLSHFYDDEQARQLDKQATAAIEALDFEGIEHHQACGAVPIRGLLWLARQKGWQAHTITLCNSGDVTGERSSVVGYGSYVFH